MRLAPLCVLFLQSAHVAGFNTVTAQVRKTERQLSVTFNAIAGDAPDSDVTQHNAIDLDQTAMKMALAMGDWTTATSHYAVGGNSLSKGSYRTLQSFSSAAESKMYDGCP